MSTPVYYREKVVGLIAKLTISDGSASEMLRNCANNIDSAYMASQFEGIPDNIKHNWTEIWDSTSNSLRISEADSILFFMKEYLRVTSEENS